MSRTPGQTNLDLHGLYRENYTPAPLLSTDRSRTRASGMDLEFTDNFGNPLKALEIRELQEEENWIRNLKMQRDKVRLPQIEEFRAEIEARDNKIRTLEDEVLRLKSSASQLIKLQAALEKAETQVRIRDKDLALQADQFKKQLKEYQNAMEDMRETLCQDQDQFQREIQKSRTQTLKDQEELSHLRSEYEKGRSFKSHTDELLETVKRESKEREAQLQEQIASSRAIEKQIKEQYTELSYEKAALEGKVKDLFQILNEQEQHLSSVKSLEDSRQVANSQIEQLKHENEKLNYEIAMLKESKEAAKTHAEEDFKLLQEDLEMCTALVKRQEQTISELRKRKMEDDSEIQSLTGRLQKTQKDLSSLRDSSKGEAEERQQVSQKLDSLTSELDRLRTENSELNKQLNGLMEKEAIERRQKEEYARLRMELISMRNKEMAAFSDALEGVAAKRFDS